MPQGTASDIGGAALFDCSGSKGATQEGVGSQGVTQTNNSGLFESASVNQPLFHPCKPLTAVTIPDGVTKIGEGAFHPCKPLAEFTISDGVTEIKISRSMSCGALPFE